MVAEEHSLSKSHSSQLVIASIFLTLLGLLSIYAASATKGASQFSTQYFFLKKQIFVACLGFVSIYLIQKIPFKFLERMVLPGMVVSLVLLLLIFIPGAYHKVGGAYRWLNLGGFRFQPSDPVKLALIFFLAKNLSRKSSNMTRFMSGIFPNIAVVGLVATLLMFQPDFGTASLIVGVTAVLLFVAGLPIKYVIVSLIGMIGAGAAAIVAAPYRMKRLVSFLDPWKHVEEGGYQIIQSYLAFQNGGLLGVGLGESRQKLGFLPEAHTDFILAVIGEELGFIGILTVVLLFSFIVWLGVSISKRQDNLFRKFLGFGLSSLIAMQALFNMGVVMGLLPTKGITLPFLSGGATSLFMFLVMIGLLAKIALETPHQDEAHD